MNIVKNKKLAQNSSVENSPSRSHTEGLWGCHSSPVGAHHWIINDSGWGECKYCSKRMEFPRLIDEHYNYLFCIGGGWLSERSEGQIELPVI